MKRNRISLLLSVCLIAALALGGVLPAAATSTATEQNVRIYASGIYHNWEGVSNVAQFKGADGSLWYAVDGDGAVTVYKTKDGAPVPGSVKLEKPHPLFGTVVCDSAGNYYLVTGEENPTDDTDRETVFISKFDGKGKLIKTVGDNGSSSLAYYYDSSFYTKIPFSGGGCDAAVSGDLLTVHYARKMYSGHQSNSVFTVNTKDMSKVDVGPFYESHSFGQRVVPTKDGFVYMSEGDCYDRGFCLYSVRLSGNRPVSSNGANVFDFWVEDGALDAFNMFVVNENFAHMGGLAALSDGKVAFAAQSAQSLSSDAASESEEIFLQIFDPNGALNTPAAYVTSGTRSGLAGNNGRTQVTNYGVKWLTSYGKEASVGNVQIVATENDEIVVLYELSRDYSYQGVWYMVLDAKGGVRRKAALFDADALLNPCETPVCADGAVYWVGNDAGGRDRLCVYRLSPSGEEAHRHQYVDHQAQAPTCTEPGWEAYRTCSGCDYTTFVEIPATGHDLVDHEAKAPTCTEPGWEAYRTCTRCDYTTFVGILPLGHDWTAATPTDAENVGWVCTRCGETKAEEPVFLPGDTDGDGTVSPEDARLTLRASVRLESFAEGSLAAKAADFDGDGQITSADARLILRRSVGLD